jgi:uncharacterized membrane protein (UPF0127 family)
VPHFLTPLFDTTAPCELRNATRGTTLARVIEPAFDSRSRRRGLLGRDCLPPDVALVIAPSNAVHTFGMRFPLDLVFATRDGSVLKIRSALGPRRIAFALKAFAVIELAGGELARSGTAPGDRLLISAVG